MKKILIIDDDKSILRMFTRILQRHGYSIEAVETGREAMEKIDTEFYDLALIDVKLPDMDGIDILNKLQKLKPEMVKIVITGYASMENGIRALNGGECAYLVKPIKPEELLKVLEENLGTGEEKEAI